ncbi:restriction endonuclease subunit S [Gulosibacter sediminis]|uniref:restriction endonuclease subunit S n=1 Tax=Gulosibacter sediminis TaxID=1729695 RepID=UPI0024A92D4A|nr:restriction endonuclease subunit S [Gulosibacter sediminis]
MKTYTISEIAQVFDGPHATPKRQDSGHYFLNISSLSRGRLDLDLSDHVSDEDFAKWTRRVTPLAGDLLFSYETRLGEAALMPEGVTACLGRRMGLLRPNRNLVDPRFLLYFYLAPPFQKLIEQNTIHGATVNRIPLNSMGSWSVRLPPLPEQQAIAEVLGALDNKIAANTALALAADGVIRTEYEKFEMTDVRVGQVANSPRVSVSPSKVAADELYVGLEHVGRRHMWLTDGGTAGEVSSAKSAFAAEDVLFGKLRPYFHKVVLAPRAGICSTDILVVRPSDHGMASVLLAALTSDAVIEQVVAASEGTRMPRTSWKDLSTATIRWPRPDQAAGTAARLDSISRAVIAAVEENRTLAATRDAFLPQLMSGKLRVRDAEAMAAAAGATTLTGVDDER